MIVSVTFDIVLPILYSNLISIKFEQNILYLPYFDELDMFGNKVIIWQNLQVLHFDPAPPQGHVMSVKCKQPLDELTVQVCLMYEHSNFKYFTLYVGGIEVWTNRRSDY